MIGQLRRLQLAWIPGTNPVRHGSDRSVSIAWIGKLARGGVRNPSCIP